MFSSFVARTRTRSCLAPHTHSLPRLCFSFLSPFCSLSLVASPSQLPLPRSPLSRLPSVKQRFPTPGILSAPFDSSVHISAFSSFSVFSCFVRSFSSPKPPKEWKIIQEANNDINEQESQPRQHIQAETKREHQFHPRPHLESVPDSSFVGSSERVRDRPEASQSAPIPNQLERIEPAGDASSRSDPSSASVKDAEYSSSVSGSAFSRPSASLLPNQYRTSFDIVHPRSFGSYVGDYANLFDEASYQEANRIFERVHSVHGVETIFVTVPALDSVAIYGQLEFSAKNLINRLNLDPEKTIFCIYVQNPHLTSIFVDLPFLARDLELELLFRAKYGDVKAFATEIERKFLQSKQMRRDLDRIALEHYDFHRLQDLSGGPPNFRGNIIKCFDSWSYFHWYLLWLLIYILSVWAWVEYYFGENFWIPVASREQLVEDNQKFAREVIQTKNRLLEITRAGAAGRSL